MKKNNRSSKEKQVLSKHKLAESPDERIARLAWIDNTVARHPEIAKSRLYQRLRRQLGKRTRHQGAGRGAGKKFLRILTDRFDQTGRTECTDD